MNPDPISYLYRFPLSDRENSHKLLYTALDAYLKARGKEIPSDLIPDTFPMALTETGKPYFPSHPSLHFSITHSAADWICAFSSLPIGIDLQKHTAKSGETLKEASSRLCRMAVRFFHPTEAAYVKAPSVENPEDLFPESFRRFFFVWSAKESYVKYTGKGIDRNFSRFSVLPEDSACFCGETSGLSAFSWQAADVSFQTLPFKEGCTLCLCTKAPLFPALLPSPPEQFPAPIFQFFSF